MIEGGFLDVDIKITGPDNHVMHESEKESSGKYTFVAPAKGVYTVCFNNERSSMTPKLVMFSIELSDAPQRAPGAPGQEEVGHTKLEDMIRELSGTLTSVKHEQEYMHVSDKFQLAIHDSIIIHVPISGARQDPSIREREHQLTRHPVVHIRGPCPGSDDRRSGVLSETILRGQTRGVSAVSV